MVKAAFRRPETGLEADCKYPYFKEKFQREGMPLHPGRRAHFFVLWEGDFRAEGGGRRDTVFGHNRSPVGVLKAAGVSAHPPKSGRASPSGVQGWKKVRQMSSDSLYIWFFLI